MARAPGPCRRCTGHAATLLPPPAANLRIVWCPGSEGAAATCHVPPQTAKPGLASSTNQLFSYTSRGNKRHHLLTVNSLSLDGDGSFRASRGSETIETVGE
jgi:hypothetical protein